MSGKLPGVPVDKFKKALKNSLCSIKDSVSKLNVEKVVRPPKSPAVRNDFKFAFDNT